jgi:hypothetical protein
MKVLLPDNIDFAALVSLRETLNAEDPATQGRTMAAININGR